MTKILILAWVVFLVLAAVWATLDSMERSSRRKFIKSKLKQYGLEEDEL